jgi:aryl-alcohol dehydrogenase-like predicted oxidoreductase
MANKLILGTVQMGLDYGVNNHSGKISFSESCAILLEAYNNGIVVLDTAEAYGNAHQVIGDFHRLNPKVKFKVITKIPDSTVYDEVAQKIKKYCEELHVDCLEVLMFHSFDTYKNCNKDLDGLESLKREGIIKHIGVSTYTNEQIEELLLDDRITVVQLPYNLLDNESIRGDLLRQLQSKGKVVHTRSAFLQGLFFAESSKNNLIYQELSDEIEVIKSIATSENTTIINLAQSYCVNQKNIDNVLIGVDSVKQLVDNLEALDYVISTESISKINAIKVKNTDLLNPSLWKRLK